MVRSQQRFDVLQGILSGAIRRALILIRVSLDYRHTRATWPLRTFASRVDTESQSVSMGGTGTGADVCRTCRPMDHPSSQNVAVNSGGQGRYNESVVLRVLTGSL